ncbi:MAG: response regulator [Terriglobales bacterium]
MPEEPGTDAPDAFAAWPITRTAKVLVVDAERGLTDSTVAILRLHGYSARGAYNGQAGIEAARAFRPDVVFMDVFMPDMNGVEAAREIRAEMPGLVVALISGQNFAFDLVRQAERERFHLLLKPVEPAKLLDKLAEWGAS